MMSQHRNRLVSPIRGRDANILRRNSLAGILGSIVRVLGALAMVACVWSPSYANAAPASPASAGAPSSTKLGAYPPWQHGFNNDTVERGLEFTVPEVDNLADFHGDPVGARLVLYVGGNYFFAMAPLVDAFERLHPEFKGAIYWETLPPGLLVKQIQDDGRITVGNMSWQAKPDVYLAGLRAVRAQVESGLLVGPAVPYVTNTLTIMVARNNPAHITGLRDLGRQNLKIALPNPEFEGVARQIKDALRKSGGDALVERVYGRKVEDGSALLTRIHHRQTPLWIMQGTVTAGVTWRSEAIFQEQAGHPIAHVNIPDAQNETAVYGGAVVANAPHPDAAHLWLEFIQSAEAAAIFERYGFKPYEPAAS